MIHFADKQRMKIFRVMAATDGQIVIAGARWSTDEVLNLGDFLAKLDESPKSELVKFVRGQFASLGVPNLPNPSLHSHAILTSLGKSLKVAAQSVKFKDGKKHVVLSSSGARFSIPETYPGYFEILSEEGKAVKCIESVNELAKKFPESVLVRESVRGFVSSIPLLELSSDKSRAINSGEVLTLQNDVTLVRSSRNYRFLQCTNSKGDYVYLNLDQRGKFSPLARNENISGVHTLKQLITNKRLPLMVRLVWGPLPVKNGSTNSVPCSELRLISTFEEDSLFALPIGQHGKEMQGSLVSLPLSCSLKFVRAKLSSNCNDNFQRLSAIATRLAREQTSKITVLDTFKENVSFWNISPSHNKQIGIKLSNKSYFLRRSVSLESQIVSPPLNKTSDNEQQEEVAPTQDFLEIDQIYDYVRGFAPLPKNIKSINFEEEVTKPLPPPIETIPVTNKKINDKKEKKLERQKNVKPKSKTALKLELHAQNVAQESLRLSERSRGIEQKQKRKTASLMLSTEVPPCIDLSTTHLLTQADLSPQHVEEPTYENAVYLESSEEVLIQAAKPTTMREKATSEIAIKSPNHYVNSKRKNSKVILQKGRNKAVKSHEDIAMKADRRSVDSERYQRQSSLSSLQADATQSPSSPTVIEHRPIEVNLHLSRPTAPTRRSSRTMKLGILYL